MAARWMRWWCRRGRDVPLDEHLIAEPSGRRAEIADVLVDRRVGAWRRLSDLLVQYPGCRIAAARVTAHRCLLEVRGAPRLRIVAVGGLAVPTCASFAHAWLSGGAVARSGETGADLVPLRCVDLLEQRECLFEVVTGGGGAAESFQGVGEQGVHVALFEACTLLTQGMQRTVEQFHRLGRGAGEQPRLRQVG